MSHLHENGSRNKSQHKLDSDQLHIALSIFELNPDNQEDKQSHQRMMANIHKFQIQKYQLKTTKPKFLDGFSISTP
jgi:hypothetical protein